MSISSQPVNLTTSGGLAVVVLAERFELPEEFAHHAQVHPLTLADLAIDREGIERQIPKSTKMVVIGGELPTTTYATLRKVLERRAITYVHRRNPPAVRESLRAMLPERSEIAEPADEAVVEAPVVAVPSESAKRGAITEFVKARADLGKGSAEEGRRVFALARAAGLTTTVGSVTQAIAILKRKGGRTETPRSLMSDQARALTTLDDAIAGLALVREYVESVETLNGKLQRRIAKMTAAMSED